MHISPWELLAGLGLFLLGMMHLEEALSKFGNASFRRILAEQTRTPVQGVFVGTLSTAFLQSSSLVSLITLAFVGAGILQLKNALGIIFGANLGTTLTGWIVATIGFKFDLADYALPLIALGALGKTFLKTDKTPIAYAGLLLGLGFLLLGLEFMKSSMAFIQTLINPDIFKNYPLPLYLLMGMLVAALIQSSSATMVLVLSALQADIIPLTTAAAVAIGADLGTTSTVLLGALKGTPDKKRVALSHLAFNLVSDSIALLAIIPLLWLITEIIGISDPMYALVAFHSAFNLIGILLFLPLINPFSRWLKNRFNEPDDSGAYYVKRVPATVTEAAIPALVQDAERLIDKTLLLNLRNFKIALETEFTQQSLNAIARDMRHKHLSFEEQYADIKQTEAQILNFAYEVLARVETETEAEQISKLLKAVRETVYAAKSLKDVRQNLTELRLQDSQNNLLKDFRTQATHIYRQLIELRAQCPDELFEERMAALYLEINQTHDQMHVNIDRQIRQAGSPLPPSSLFNINREISVSHKALADATRTLRDIGP